MPSRRSDQYSNGAIVEVMDSQTTAIGLGMLVQLAAGAASDGAIPEEIDQRLRASIPRVYHVVLYPGTDLPGEFRPDGQCPGSGCRDDGDVTHLCL